MDNVINFPARSEHSWNKVEQSIRTMLNKTMADAAMQDDILAHMKNAYEKYNATFNIKLNMKMPSGTTPDDKKNIADNFRQAFGDLETQVQDLMQEALMDRLLLEIQLYNARKSARKNSK